jgi:ribulose 1,5-bisphosphate synthetase/thiazole synthase
MTSPLRIRIRDAYDGKPQRFYPVVVVGAGASGIATGCRLKERCGFDQFRIFDRQAGIGGEFCAIGASKLGPQSGLTRESERHLVDQ